MKAVLLEKTGGVNVLEVSHLVDPMLGEGDVQVDIRYAGVNYADILSRQGLYNWSNPLPYVLGLESSGVVAAVGAQVKKLRVGDRVVVAAKGGNYAEKIVQPADSLLPAPDALDFPELACLCGNWFTAWVALFELARVRSGEVALIHSGAGGVGTAAIQLAVAGGMQVYATTSTPAKMDYVRSLGAMPLSYADFDRAIAQAGKADFILESVGGEVYRRSLASLAPLGKLVTIGASSIRVDRWNPVSWYRAWKALPHIRLVDLKSQGFMTLHVGFLLEDHREAIAPIWQRMTDYMTENQLKPVVHPECIFPMSQVREAHLLIEQRKNIGKVLLDPSR